MQSSICSMTASSIVTDFVNFSPPWTTRCPTAAMSPIEVTPGTLESGETSQRSTVSRAARWSRRGAVLRAVGFPSARRVMRASLPIRSMTPWARVLSAFFSMASRSVSMTWNFRDELPLLRTRTIMASSYQQDPAGPLSQTAHLSF